MEVAEILTTGWCPNNCVYCYIPKNEVMRELHKEIIADLKTGKYIERLKKICGDGLKTLSFWGTEPTLTLDLIQPLLPQLTQVFPKLNEMCFSTSMIAFEPIARFIEALQGYDIKLRVQVSLDGPAFITDKNRFKGAAKKVPQNFFALVSAIQDRREEATLLPSIAIPSLAKLALPTKVEFHWKATLTSKNIKVMNDDSSKIDEYYHYFENLNEKFDKINQNKNISLNKGSFTPTLEAPGSYTSEEGKEFAQFLRNLRQKKYKSVYSFKLGKILDFWNELGTKKRMFTCSGGDSNSGISENLHICHRSFYLDNDRYVNSVLQQDTANWDIPHLRKGAVDLLRKYYIVDMKQDAEITRLKYIMRNYHDFWQLQMGYIKAMMIELALVGQVSQQYLESDGLSEVFALFVTSAWSCPLEDILNVGNMHLTSSSMLRMFGNGAFQELLNDIPRRKR